MNGQKLATSCSLTVKALGNPFQLGGFFVKLLWRWHHIPQGTLHHLWYFVSRTIGITQGYNFSLWRFCMLRTMC